jgi:hypothetical protein
LFLLRKKGFSTKALRHKEKNFIVDFASQNGYLPRRQEGVFFERQSGVLFCFAKNGLATKGKTSLLLLRKKGICRKDGKAFLEKQGGKENAAHF